MAVAHHHLATSLPIARHAFRAMGTDVLLVLDAPPRADVLAHLRAAERLVRDLERTFTRFDQGSELRRLERHRARRCSPELTEVIDLALHARRVTGGLFDPTVLPALRAAGYDRTFHEVARDPRPSADPIPANGGVHVDVDRQLVALAPGVALDLGGIAKGWIVDRVAEQLDQVAGTLVDAGGDIRCTPRQDGRPWEVDVEGADLRLRVEYGAVATSGTDRRRWVDPGSGRVQHHVIDPRTGAPSRSDLVRVTTVARTCADAEVASTALLVCGSAAAHELGARLGCAWHATTEHRTTTGSETMR